VVEALLDITRELSVWLLLGAAVAGLLHVALPPGWLMSKLRGRAGVIRAVVLGVPLPLCSCGVIPAGIGLKRDGASDGASLAFLISTPQTGVDSVMVSGAMLGWPFAIFKLLSASVLGLVGGALAEFGPAAPSDTTPSAGSEHHSRNLREAISHAVDVIRSIWRWLVLGIVASAAIQAWIPPEVFGQMASAGETSSILIVLVISVPLYVCATASVPIAASLVAGGMPASAALVFLVAGPATNTATLGAVYRTFGARKLAIYLGTIIIGSVLFGLLFDAVLPTPELIAPSSSEHGGLGANLAALGLAALMLRFAFEDLKRWATSRKPIPSEAHLFSVQGMTCNGCVSKAESALLGVDGVVSAQVHLARGEAQVVGRFAPTDITSALGAAGFSASEERAERPPS